MSESAAVQCIPTPPIPHATSGDYKDLVIESLSADNLALEDRVVELTADCDALREVLHRSLDALTSVAVQRDQAIYDLRRIRRQDWIVRRAERVA